MIGLYNLSRMRKIKKEKFNLFENKLNLLYSNKYKNLNIILIKLNK